MQKQEIAITIKGTQQDITEESIENTYTGQCTLLSDCHIIQYEEYLDEEAGSHSACRNLVRIDEHSIRITKKGAVNTKMHFKQGKKHFGVYQTPFGNFDMIIETKQLSIQHKDSEIHADITYSLSLNRCPASQCRIQMKITGLT